MSSSLRGKLEASSFGLTKDEKVSCKKWFTSKSIFPPSHAWGFAKSPCDFFENHSNEFYFFGGCSYDSKSRSSEDFNFIIKYNPSMQQFQYIQKKMPNDFNLAPRYRQTIIIRPAKKKVKKHKRKALKMNKNEKSKKDMDTNHPCMIVFAGISDGGFTNELFEFNLHTKKWRILHFTNPPIPIGFHQSLYRNKDDCMYVFGGKNDEIKRVKVILKCDFSRKKWEKIEPKVDTIEPHGRGGHCLNWKNKRQNKFVIFGGINNKDQDLNDTWEFNLEKKKWKKYETKGVPPSPRASHSSVIFKNFLYVFSGAGGATLRFDQFDLVGDLYRLNLKTFFWEEINIIGDKVNPCYIHRMGLFCDENLNVKMFSIGGINGNIVSGKEDGSSTNDIYIFTLGDLKSIKDNEFVFKRNMFKRRLFIDIILKCCMYSTS